MQNANAALRGEIKQLEQQREGIAQAAQDPKLPPQAKQSLVSSVAQLNQMIEQRKQALSKLEQ